MRYYYAQNKEDLLIKTFFPDVTKGFYVDVGANDPQLDSVTKLFYDDGWNGINVEPIERHHQALKKSRPRDHNIQVGVGSEAGSLEFTEYPGGDGLSTFDKTMSGYYESSNHHFPTQKAKKYSVEVRTLTEIISQVRPEHIHFMKIDVEGFEFEVISGCDWKTVRPELICIEANHISKDWRPILKRNDYEEVFFDGINNYYLAKESLHRLKYFSYPDAVFAGNPVYYPAVREIAEPLEQKNEQLATQLSDKEQEIFILEKRQRDVRFLAKRLYAEMLIRVSARSQESGNREGHIYQADESVTKASKDTQASKDKLITFIRRRDEDNIKLKKSGIKDRLMPMFWKLVYRVLSLGVAVAKRVKRA